MPRWFYGFFGGKPLGRNEKIWKSCYCRGERCIAFLRGFRGGRDPGLRTSHGVFQLVPRDWCIAAPVRSRSPRGLATLGIRHRRRLLSTTTEPPFPFVFFSKSGETFVSRAVGFVLRPRCTGVVRGRPAANAGLLLSSGSDSWSGSETCVRRPIRRLRKLASRNRTPQRMRKSPLTSPTYLPKTRTSFRLSSVMTNGSKRSLAASRRTVSVAELDP